MMDAEQRAEIRTEAEEALAFLENEGRVCPVNVHPGEILECLDAMDERDALRKRLKSWLDGTVRVCASCQSESLTNLTGGLVRCDKCGTVQPIAGAMTWQEWGQGFREALGCEPGDMPEDVARRLKGRVARLEAALHRMLVSAMRADVDGVPDGCLFCGIDGHEAGCPVPVARAALGEESA